MNHDNPESNVYKLPTHGEYVTGECVTPYILNP